METTNEPNAAESAAVLPQVPPAASKARNARLRLEGLAELAVVGDLHRAAVAAAGTGKAVVVDCGGVEHVSAAALQVLVALAAEMDRQGRSLRIDGLLPRLHPVLAMAGLDSRLGPVRKRKG